MLAAAAPMAVYATGLTSRTAPGNGLGNTIGVSARSQLRAMTTAIKSGDAYFGGRPTGCNGITPMLAAEPGTTLAGNFRDADGNCYVWLNLSQSQLLTGSEVCKLTLHELGHLAGLSHSSDPADVMFTPFEADPLPAPCQAPSRARRART